MSRHFRLPEPGRVIPRGGRLGRAFVLYGLCACCSVFAAAPAAHAQAAHDIVLVIDVSTSMRGLFPNVRERLLQEIDQAKVGDRVVLVTFGESAHLLARRRVRGAADRAYLRAIVEDLSPAQRATYLTEGLDRGFTELTELFERSPERARRLLWLSDGKNNPPAVLGDQVLTLSDLREKHEADTPAGEWFEFDAPLGDPFGAEFTEFMQWARRSLFRIRVGQPAVALGEFPGPAVSAQTTVRFDPQVRVLQGLEFLVVARVVKTGAADGQHRDLKVEPSTVVVQDAPWSETFTLSFDGPPGEYEGYLVFESFARESFLVEPERIPLSFTLAPPLVIREEPEIADIVAQTFAEAQESDKGVRGLGGKRRPVEFGPIRPGRRYMEKLSFSTTAPVELEQLQTEVEIALPEGCTLSYDLEGGDTDFILRVTLDVAGGAELPDALHVGGAFDGMLKLTVDDPHVQVWPASRQLLVRLPVSAPVLPIPSAPRAQPAAPGPEGAPPAADAPIPEGAAPGVGVRVPRESPAPSPEAAPESAPPASRQPTIFDAAAFAERVPWTAYLTYIYYAAGGVAVLLLLVALRRAVRRRPKETHFFGEFIVVKDPGLRKLRNVDLKRVGALHGHQTLIIGSGARADIRLRNVSVHPLHARLTTEVGPRGLDVVLYPGRGAEVGVNDEPLADARPLRDKDLVQLGNYLFLFSAPAPVRRLVVHFVDGSVLHGTPVEWNIAEPSFKLLVENGEGENQVAHVEFAELKAVYFVNEDGESGHPGPLPEQFRTDRPIDVEFPDGEVLHGRALRDYTEYADRFYVIPEYQEGLSAVLVERTNVKAVRVGTNGSGARNGDGRT